MTRSFLAFVFVALAATAALAAACGEDDDEVNGGNGATATPSDTPVTATPAQPDDTSRSVLHEARIDLAQRLETSPLALDVTSLQHAGWDGCLGLYQEGVACTEQFIGGYIALFRRAEATAPFRYHVGGVRFVAVDFEDGEIDDGMAVPPELQVDFNEVLARYARHDLSQRTGAAPAAIAVTAIIPHDFSDGCIGFRTSPNQACDDAITPGAFVLLLTEGEEYRYHVSASVGATATDFVNGEVFAEPGAEAIGTQREMRQDLADRTGADLDDISIVSYRDVIWPNGCLGVQRPGEVCTQALVPGFLAILTDGTGQTYRYHGTGTIFVAADFVADATIGDPLPVEE